MHICAVTQLLYVLFFVLSMVRFSLFLWKGGLVLSYSKEERWIKQKIRSGQSQSNLIHCVGSFSNKSKDVVMKRKGLSSFEYDERYGFLSRVYVLLTSGKKYD